MLTIPFQYSKSTTVGILDQMDTYNLI